MEALKSFDPDEDFKVIKPEKALKLDLRAGDKCPTCKQRIEKKNARIDIENVIKAFKMATGYDKDDVAWDRAFYRRNIPPAKRLLDFLGGWELAADAIQDISEKMNELGRTFTIETILNHSASWKKDRQEREPKAGR